MLRECQARPFGKYTYRIVYSAEINTWFRHPAPCNQDDIEPLFQVRVMLPDRFAHPSLDPVSPDRISNSSTNSKAVPVVVQPVRLFHEHQVRRRPGPPAFADPLKLPRVAQPQTSCDHSRRDLLARRGLVLGGNGERLPAASSPCGDHRAATARLHSSAESMRPLPWNSFWLICALRHR
jgi:hypothetical protein